jgi:hypothetical protein
MSLEAWGDEGDDSPYTDERVDELIAEATQELKGALMDAVAVIKTWHNMGFKNTGFSEARADEVWKIYYDSAPEMRSIREMLK